MGGAFTSATNSSGTVAAAGLATWDGSDWSPLLDNDDLPIGLSDGQVNALAINGDGGLIVGGTMSGVFTGSGTTSVAHIAGFKSGVWQDLDGGIPTGNVNAIQAVPVSGGKFIIGGNFTGGSGNPWGNNIAVWTGVTGSAGSWSALGGSSAVSGVDGPVNAIAARTTTEYYFGGSFGMAARAGYSTVAASNVVLWAGSSWYQLRGDNNAMESMVTGYPTVVHALRLTPMQDLAVGAELNSWQGNGNIASAFSTWSYLGVPWFALQPPMGQNMGTGCPRSGDTITLPARAALGFDFTGPLTYMWKHNTITVVNGSHGTNGSSGTAGGTVSGADTDTLKIVGYVSADVGGYTLTITNSCGSTVSHLATLALTCSADFNQSCSLEVQDIFDFLNAWFSGCTGQSGSPCFGRSANFNQQNGLEVQDIFDFLNAWFAGDPRADINGSGHVTTQDIFDYLNQWFSGC